MSELAEGSPVLVFRPRPKSVPADLRISWRLSMTLLALHYCRGKRASFIKLHLLNGALRSSIARGRLLKFLNGNSDLETCTIRVEPAFSRNLDLLIGKGLAEWSVASARLGVRMTPQGINVAKQIDAEEGLFTDEREFLATTGHQVTERLVRSIVSACKRGPV